MPERLYDLIARAVVGIAWLADRAVCAWANLTNSEEIE